MARVLSFDPGAERMGWAVLEGDGETAPVYVASGVAKCPRGDMEFQPYKLKLIEHWTFLAPAMFQEYKPDKVCSEILPAVGGGSFVAATQSELGKAAITTVHAMAFERSYPVEQISAITIKKDIGGKKTATKVAVRNGVIRLLPALASRKSEWTKVFDEPDALGAGLAKMGYTVLRLV